VTLKESTHELAEAIRSFEAVADRMDRLGERMTENVAALRGLALNDVLWSGMVPLDAVAFKWQQSFTVPFAGVFVWDPMGVGPVFVRNAPFEDNIQPNGVGALVIEKNRALAVPLVGRELSIWTAATSGVVGVTILARPPQPFSGVA
jgi:hypothetical protein